MRFSILCMALLALLGLAACGEAPPGAAPTATEPAATATTEVRATEPPPTETSVPPTPTSPAPTPTIEATATPSPEALAPGGWAMLNAAGGPKARYDHTATIDPVRNQLVVFGGRGDGTFGDTWIFNFLSNTWREVQGEGPPPRFGHGMVYDRANRRMILVMGEGASFFNDVWAFDLENETWAQLKETTNGAPRPRYGQSAALDGQGRVLISHGFSDQGRFDDTWAFDPSSASWVELTPETGPKPLKRCLHELAYDAQDDRLLLFGGCSSGFGPCPQGDLWAFDLKSRTWIELTPDGDKPSARSNPSLAFDQTNRKLFLFGGLAQGGPVGDTWVYDLASNTWTSMESEVSPSPRSSQGTGYDPQRKRAVIFGGRTANGPSMEIWQSGF